MNDLTPSLAHGAGEGWGGVLSLGLTNVQLEWVLWFDGLTTNGQLMLWFDRPVLSPTKGSPRTVKGVVVRRACPEPDEGLTTTG